MYWKTLGGREYYIYQCKTSILLGARRYLRNLKQDGVEELRNQENFTNLQEEIVETVAEALDIIETTLIDRREKLKPMNCKLIGSRMKYLRKISGFKQEEIAYEMSMSQPGYRNYELGNRKIPLKKFIDFCVILDLSLDDIRKIL